MALTVELLRPEDLLFLRVEGINLRLDLASPRGPRLVREDRNQPAFLFFHFPPQSIAEESYFDARNPTGSTQSNTTETPKAPGEVPARAASASRLVFRLPDDVESVPYSTEGLLEWSRWLLNVAPVALMPAQPTEEQRASAPEVIEPAPIETAIELPYRLVLSPSADVEWRHARVPVRHRSRTELWHTRLAHRPASGGPIAGEALPALELTARNPALLRAVWSPDFQPLNPPGPALDRSPFHTSLTPRNRYQIVARTSAFHGFAENDGRPAVPKPIQADRLFLSALGGWLRSRGAWGPPSLSVAGEQFRDRWFDELGALTATDRPADDRELPTAARTLVERVPKDLLTAGVIDANAGLLDPAALEPPPELNVPSAQVLDLSEWIHLATQGRDHYVRIVTEGQLCPFGHRAALVQISERRFEAAPSGPTQGAPVAYLRRRAYIVVREPEKSYFREVRDEFSRSLPLGRSVRILTLVTPNIEDPEKPPSQISGTDGSFWVRVAGKEFPFPIVARDLMDHDVHFPAPLIFVPDGAKEAAHQTVRAEYVKLDPRRACPVPGQKVAFAPPTPERPDDTALTATALYFTMAEGGRDCLPQLDKAEVRIPALEALAGVGTVTTIKLYKPYVGEGLDGEAGVFAELETPLAVGFSADKAGGIATPNLSVKGISRELGPVAGTLDSAANGQFHPKDFFPKAEAAKLFGSVSLEDLLSADAIKVGAPTIRTEIFPPPPAPPREIVTSFDWEPRVKGDLKGIVETDAATRLRIHGRQIKPVGSGSEGGRFELSGELTAFQVYLAKVVRLRFDKFRFAAASGQKTDVQVQLADQEPVTFEGALEFVRRLAEVLPKGVFGQDGPSLDLSPTGLTVGYSLGLPTLSIGVFALQNIRLSTQLMLPFLNGKPRFDFSFAERHHPFLLTVFILGGGGFLHLALDAERVIMVEGQLEFGGALHLDIGVATGSVHVLAGFYFRIEFRIEANEAELSAFFEVAGEVSVLGIISVSVLFHVSLSFFPTPTPVRVRGRATLVVAVKIIFTIKVELTVEKTFTAPDGDPVFRDMLSPSDWQSYARAFA